jgi:hypothetical protein
MRENRRSTAGERYRPVIISALIAGALLAVTLMLMVPLVRAASGEISGTVTYYGSRPSTIGIQLAVFTTTAATAPSPVATGDASTADGAYTIDDVEEGVYFVFTYLDLNGSNTYEPAQEPYAWYDYEGDGRPDAVTVAPGGVTRGIDILLTDLWQPLGGPLGKVNALAARPGVSGTLFAALGRPYSGSDTTIYTTTDGGMQWTAVYTGPNHRIEALATLGTLVYGGGESTGGTGLIVQSTDAGATWTEVFTGTGQDAGALRDLAIDPVASTTAYAAGYARGDDTGYATEGTVYRTADNGLNWTPVLTVVESDLLAVAVNPVTPTMLFAGGYYKIGTAQYAALFEGYRI